eukprot:jgi/Mesvir1/14584/Mv05259-RA.3
MATCASISFHPCVRHLASCSGARRDSVAPPRSQTLRPGPEHGSCPFNTALPWCRLRHTPLKANVSFLRSTAKRVMCSNGQQTGGESAPSNKEGETQQAPKKEEFKVDVEETARLLEAMYPSKKDSPPKVDVEETARLLEAMYPSKKDSPPKLTTGRENPMKQPIDTEKYVSLDDLVNQKEKAIEDLMDRVQKDQTVDIRAAVLDILGPMKVNRDDMKLFKEKACGYGTFWATEMVPYGNALEGYLIKGNVRGDKEACFAYLEKEMTALFGNKYVLFMIPEPATRGDFPEEDSDGSVRPAILVLRREVATPKPNTWWQAFIAVSLLPIDALTCVSVGLLTQLENLPPQFLELLSNPATDISSSTFPEFDPVPLVANSIPLGTSLIVLQVLHEIGHRIVAGSKGVKLGVPFFIPNLNLGLFGAVTQIKSLVRNNRDMFDIVMAGPLAGGAASLILLVTGLVLSSGGPGSDGVVGVPFGFFESSALLALLTQAAVGYDEMSGAMIHVHPILLVGWCGLMINALNLLPLGALDGGQAANVSGPSWVALEAPS